MVNLFSLGCLVELCLTKERNQSLSIWVESACSRKFESCPALAMKSRVSSLLHLVPHFSELLKCGKIWQSQDEVALLHPITKSLVFLNLNLHVEVWKYEHVLTNWVWCRAFPNSSTPCYSFNLAPLVCYIKNNKRFITRRKAWHYGITLLGLTALPHL